MLEIAKDVYHIPLMPRNSINAYLIEGFLVDAGIRSSYKKLGRSLQNMNVHTHVLTHAHADHQGSSKKICELFDLPFWCSLEEKAQAESGMATKEYPKQNHIVTKFQQKYWAGEGRKVDKTIREGDTLGNFKVIETPGHSSGHLSFFRERDGVLILGDTALNMNLLTTNKGLHEPPILFTKDKELNRISLKKLAKLKPEILCFGHGPVLQNKNGEFEQFVHDIISL
ncbi:MAG: MBL fold metallo-hydrolase [Gracilimonas sp.]